MRAYPRVGGGTTWSAGWRATCKGLSPRGRGNHLVDRVELHVQGPIPAWAGEPPPEDVALFVMRAYPRVGGGTASRTLRSGDFWGLSPRGRGNRELSDLRLALAGPIPAWAGEPTGRSRLSTPRRAYPRVGGGTTLGELAG